MARRDQMDRFMVGGERGPSASNRPDPNAGRRPGDPYIIAQDSRPVGIEGLNKDEQRQYRDFLTASNLGFRGAKTPGMTDRQASKLGRMAFDQFRNLQSGGDYAPALKAGMTVPGGTIARRPQAERGLGSFLGGGGFLGGIMDAIGGNAPKTIQASGGSGRRGRGSFNLNTGQTSAMNPNVGRRDVLSRMITERPSDSRPSSRVPAGGITNVFSDLGRNVGSASAIPLSTPVLLSTSPSSTDQTVFGSDIFEEAVGATPEESGTFIIGDKIFPVDTQERFFTTEGVTPEEQAYLNEIRDDDLADDYSTGPETRFERAMADRVALLNAAQEAADATDLAEINMLMRGRELADRDAGNLALQESIGQAIASAQIRDAERAAANQAVMDAIRDEQNRKADLEEMFMEPNLDLMPFMEDLEKFIENSTYRGPEVVPDNEGDDRMLRSGMIVGPMGL